MPTQDRWSAEAFVYQRPRKGIDSLCVTINGGRYSPPSCIQPPRMNRPGRLGSLVHLSMTAGPTGWNGPESIVLLWCAEQRADQLLEFDCSPFAPFLGFNFPMQLDCAGKHG